MTLESVLQILGLAVLEGSIRRADVLFSFSQAERKCLQEFFSIAEDPRTDIHRLHEALQLAGGFLGMGKDVEFDEFALLRSFHHRRAVLGDFYELLAGLERSLHEKVRGCLEDHFGTNEADWWGKGVPGEVREKCVSLREEAKDYQTHAYCFTILINLKEIIETKENWKEIFSERLPRAWRSDKDRFKREFVKLNDIRNKVMHPVRSEDPSEEEYKFVRGLRQLLAPANWE